MKCEHGTAGCPGVGDKHWCHDGPAKKIQSRMSRERLGYFRRLMVHHAVAGEHTAVVVLTASELHELLTEIDHLGSAE